MNTLPLSIGKIHFIGIGGIGMSGIAEVLHELGYKITGSDISENSNTERLIKLGIKIKIGHSNNNINKKSIVVVSSAINEDNVELIAAKEKNIPVVHRSEMLNELMRLKWSVAVAGTHGKTSTTSIISSILFHSGLDPTVINGGIIKGWGSNARLGKGDWMVVEADESDGSFTKFSPTVAVVTNIDKEHLDFHKTFKNLKSSFQKFLSSIPFYGFKVLCIDHPVVQTLIPLNKDRKLITYGKSSNADVQAINIKFSNKQMIFDICFSNRMKVKNKVWTNVCLPMLGDHNILNCLASISVASEMEIEEEKIKSSLKNFEGIKRRFEIKGKTIDEITVVDDYCHHPVEIKSVLNSSRIYAENNKVFAVFQPHRFSRINDLFNEFCGSFNEANYVFVTDIYSAGEKAINGINKETISMGIRDYGHKNVYTVESKNNLIEKVSNLSSSGDLVIFMGAGSITSWSDSFINDLDNFGK